LQKETEGGATIMCEFLDEIENRGLVKGRAEGKIYGMVKVYVNDMHLSAEEISLKLNRDIEEIKDIMSKIE
jgi:predicted transposase YdaD